MALCVRTGCNLRRKSHFTTSSSLILHECAGTLVKEEEEEGEGREREREKEKTEKRVFAVTSNRFLAEPVNESCHPVGHVNRKHVYKL